MVKADSLSSLSYPHYATDVFLRAKSELMCAMRVQCICSVSTFGWYLEALVV